MTYVQAVTADKRFQKRMRHIERRHSKLSKGYLMTVTHDGLVVPQPRRLNLRFPVRALLVAALSVVFFKAFALAFLGTASYDARISALASGTAAERMGAFLMQADPVSRFVADKIAPYIR